MIIRYPLGLILLILSALSLADIGNTSPARVGNESQENIEFDQKLGGHLPLHLLFRTEQGNNVRLNTLLRERPTVLVAGYYHCAGLCGAVRAGLMQAVTRMGLEPGRDLNVVLFSIDPRDNTTTASAAQQRDQQHFPGAHVSNWRYLTGDETSGPALAAAMGFRYVFDANSGQFNHPAGIVLLTPEGRISHYLFGVQFEPQTLRLALVAASRGNIGNIVDRLLLLCSHYDATTGRYTPVIERLLIAFSLGSVVLLGGGIVLLRRRERIPIVCTHHE